MGRNEIVFVLAVLAIATALLLSGHPFWIGLAAAVPAFTLVWLVSLPIRNASIVDVFWGPGFILVGCLYLLNLPAGISLRALLVCVLTTVWGLRLALHIGVRNRGKGEDFRYAAWREQAGSSFWWVSLFKVFLLQAIVLWLVSSPLLLAGLEGREFGMTTTDLLGATLWLVGFAFEAVADWQLLRFKHKPGNRGQVMRSGLWGLSRHPNYFGEALLWWGIGLLALPTGGWLALAGPAFLTFLLVKISGVAMLDEALIERRPGYADYVRSTPAFLPFRLSRRAPRSAAADGA